MAGPAAGRVPQRIPEGQPEVARLVQLYCRTNTMNRDPREPLGPSVESLTQRKDEFFNQGVRALLLINGGGAVALLAFVQAIWIEAQGLAAFVLVGASFFTIGAFLAAIVNFGRYYAAMYRDAWYDKGRAFWVNVYFWAAVASMVCFLVGAGVVIVGGFLQLA